LRVEGRGSRVYERAIGNGRERGTRRNGSRKEEEKSREEELRRKTE
jgi:hypothetical protein